MKKIFVFLSVLTIAFSSCVKTNNSCPYNESTTTASQAESDAVASYLSSAGITDAVKHSSGFYYKIVSQGTGTATPNLCSQISIYYKGQLTNGNVFDQATSTPANFGLGQLIVGWQKGIPLIKTGGKIILYLPPSLGYGAQAIRDQLGNTIIPANSILVFTIDLIAVN